MPLIRTVTLGAALLFSPLWATSIVFAADSTTAAVKPVAELPEIARLVDPLTFSDGTKVRNRQDWERRRAELKKLFEDYEYGSLPPKPERVEILRGEVIINKQFGVSTQNFVISMGQGYGNLDVHFSLNIPLNAKGKVPVVIQAGDGGLSPLPPWPGFPPPPVQTGPDIFTQRGYATASFRYTQLAADNKDTARKGGIYTLFNDQIDTGALMAWAWGMHRIIDVLTTQPRIDINKVVVTGHSRYGKASLIAGAFDERIALTVPSHSGAAGAAPYRFIYGKNEQLHNIAGYAPQWFRPGFEQFVDHVNQLPVDQHLLKALVAPRALLTTEGTLDEWTNPQGSQLTYLAAKQAYEFLDAADKISIKYRPVGHIPSNEDLLDYADHLFFGKPLSKEFGELPYEVDTNARK